MAGLDDIAEQKEWTDAISSVIAFEGTARADDLLEEVVAVARRSGGHVPFAANTAYINTILPEAQPPIPATGKSRTGSMPRSAGTQRPSS